MERLILAIAVQPILIFLFGVGVSAVRYISDEINHTVKNFKRSIRETWWDLEWKWNHR